MTKTAQGRCRILEQEVVTGSTTRTSCYCGRNCSVLASQMHLGYDIGAGIKLSEDFQFSYTNTCGFRCSRRLTHGLTINANNPFIPAQAALALMAQKMTRTTLSRSGGPIPTKLWQFTRINDRYTF